MKASRRSELARPSNFLAFFHDRPSRCRAARMVSRQHRRPNRACTKPTSRFSVQRGFGSAPAAGGAAGCCWAARTSAERGCDVRAKGGRPPVRRYSSASGRVRCSRAASPSRSAGGGRSVQRRPWRRHLVRCHGGQGSARGCERAGLSGPGGADPPTSVPSVHDQLVAPVSARPFRKTIIWETALTQPSTPTMGFKLDVV